MIDLKAYLQRLTEACEHYQKSAPTVEAHCDDLYRRITSSPAKVTLAELIDVAGLWCDSEDGLQWFHPNAAANVVYKLRHRLGMDTTGHAGF